MAHDVHRPHDKLFRTVFADQRQAAALLQAHLPESIAGHLRWSSLALQDRTFVDDELLDSESDLLFSVKRTAGHPGHGLYVLLEHESRPDRWMPFRLLKYCCLIWDRARQQYPNERRLRPIVPLVFYQGRRRWRHPTEFAELFAAPVRDWPWVPRFAHLLVDQSQVGPQAVRGRLQGRIAQLMMMARYRHRREALRHAARLLAQMLTGGGGEAVRPLVRYLLATQTRNTARRFGDELRDAVPGVGGDLMTTYAEELIREGERKGRLETIEALLRAGVEWPVIEAATGIDQDALRALRQRLEGSEEGTKEAG